MTTIVIKRNSVIAHGNMEKGIFLLLCYATGALILGYLFFIGHITFTVLARKSLETKERALSSQIGEMELEYLALNQAVDLDLAYGLGFKNAESNTYFADLTKGNTVGFNNHD